MEKTREEIIELKCQAWAILRKAQCRAVNCDVVDAIGLVVNKLDRIDEMLTEIIGD